MIVEDSAGTTPPAIVTIVFMLIFVTVVLDWMPLVDFMTEFAIKSILTGNVLPDQKNQQEETRRETVITSEQPATVW